MTPSLLPARWLRLAGAAAFAVVACSAAPAYAVPVVPPTTVPSTVPSTVSAGTEVALAALGAASDGMVVGPDPVAVHAVVTVDAAAVTVGTVTFAIDGVTIGSDSVGSDGFAVTVRPTSLTPGPHRLSASWTDGATSASSPVLPLTVDPGDGTASIGPISTVLPAGTLVLTSPFGGPGSPGSSLDNPFPLATSELDTEGDCYRSTTALPPLTLTDTRSATQPFTISVMASNLVNLTPDLLSNGDNAIDAQDVGLVVAGVTNNFADRSLVVVPPGTAFSTDANVTIVENPSAPCVPLGTPGSLGLGGGVTHALAHVVSGTGTIRIDPVVTIAAPTTTTAGRYVGTLTFTFLGA